MQPVHQTRLLFLSAVLGLSCLAQPETTGDVLKDARALAAKDQPEKAIALLNERLEGHPQDSDARVLLGLICSWNKRWEEGRRAFMTVLQADPDYKDAVLGLINLQIWSGFTASAAELAKDGLTHRPDDPDYLAALAKADAALQEDARVAAMRRINHNGPTADKEVGWEAGITESNIWFSDSRSSWHETAVSLSKNVASEWITARFSHASWFGEGSNLFELESYPKIRPGTYGYLEGAFSPDGTLYARRRFGAEIFQSIPKGFEASVGFRYMTFGHTNTVLYTASAGKYFGNYWFLARTFVSGLDSPTGISKSLQVSARRYFHDADHFIGVRVGVGASPFEVRSVIDTGVQSSESAAFESLWKFHNGFRFRVTGGVARQTRFGLGPLWQIEADGTLYYAF
ncbi:MAG TPA: YaiO family outer membrane beta-barrel protein [Bryobacteraceae bacterium]